MKKIFTSIQHGARIRDPNILSDATNKLIHKIAKLFLLLTTLIIFINENVGVYVLTGLQSTHETGI